MIVAYYTPGPYENEAAGLVDSLDAAGIPPELYEIQCLPSAGDWRANAHLRPMFLRNKMDANPGRPLLSLDVDCRVRSNPLPYLQTLDCDIAFHTHTQLTGRLEPLPGTLWLNPTGPVEHLLDAWNAFNICKPDRNDRDNFADAVAGIPRPVHLRIGRLPPAYCFIFDTFRRMYPGVVPVIEHFQASRRLRDVPAYAHVPGAAP